MWDRIGVVLTKEIVDNLRDRRTLLASLFYPLLGPLMLAAIFTFLGPSMEAEAEKPLPLPVVGAEHAPNLIAFLEQSNVEVQPAPADPEAAVRAGDEDVVLIIPEGFGEAWRAGHPATVRLVVDDSRQSASTEIERAQRVLEGYSQQIGVLRLMARGISPTTIQPLAVEQTNVATPQSQAGNLLSMSPYFIILSVFIGGMYLAIDSTAGERERGSLEPLLINPVSRTELVMGKLLATILFTVVAVAETLLAMGLVLNNVPLDINVSLQPAALFVIFLLTLPIMVMAAALQIIVATFTGSFKEAQNYISFMSLVPALPGMFLVFSPVRADLWTMLIPTFGQQLLISQVLRGSALSPLNVATASLVTLLLSFLLVLVAIRLYQREEVLFRK